MSTTTKRRATRASSRKATAKKTTTRKRGTRVTYVPSEAEIQQRAYQIFLNRGGEHGHDLDDWLQAERELRQSTTL